MIAIESQCGHLKTCIRGLVMRVIMGELRGDLAIACPECCRVAFSVREARVVRAVGS